MNLKTSCYCYALIRNLLLKGLSAIPDENKVFGFSYLPSLRFKYYSEDYFYPYCSRGTIC